MDEVLRVATRYGLTSIFVANTGLRLPRRDSVRLVIVDDATDATDDWIADHVAPADVVVTADIPLAARCLEAGAHMLDPRGRELTDNDVGEALASRELMASLRGAGAVTGGPPRSGSRTARTSSRGSTGSSSACGGHGESQRPLAT